MPLLTIMVLKSVGLKSIKLIGDSKMSEKICEQCNGKGEQTFHKGTPREYRSYCPSCGGTGFKNGKTNELRKGILEV